MYHALYSKTVSKNGDKIHDQNQHSAEKPASANHGKRKLQI